MNLLKKILFGEHKQPRTKEEIDAKVHDFISRGLTFSEIEAELGIRRVPKY